MVELICPDCGKRFNWTVRDIGMISESLRRNPALKIICGACGRQREIYFAIKAKLRKGKR
jgi:hypothetical protein